MSPNRAPKRRAEYALQLLVVLPNTDPLVWRRLLVPESYSFWDLHVAIQDAMGWLDYHLHEFQAIEAESDRVARIGIPQDEMQEERPCLPGWEVPIDRFLFPGKAPVHYWYDFGDDWKHTVVAEDITEADSDPYPRCLGGAGACPPEDVGGTHGYKRFLEAIRDPEHPEHAKFVEWIGGGFDPHDFDPDAVTFDDPGARWTLAFGEFEADA